MLIDDHHTIWTYIAKILKKLNLISNVSAKCIVMWIGGIFYRKMWG